MVIRGATFDWWGTIAVIPPRDDAGQMRELRISRLDEMLRKHGIASDRPTLYRAYDRQGELLEDAWANHREPSPEQQVHAFLRFARIDARDPRIATAVGEAIGGAILLRMPMLFPHIEETLLRLSERGLAIGLVSNTGRSWGRYLTKIQEAQGIGRFFRVRVYSDEKRVRKPDPRMFEAAAAGLTLEPREMVHIGDDVVADVEAAKAAGMRAVWFNTGFWPDAKTDRADAEIHDLRELPKVLEAMT